MKTALVFGASGQIGLPLLDRLRDDGWRVYAVSRSAHPEQPGLTWLQGDLARVEGLPRHSHAIFSCGPLDLFAQWYARTEVESPRVVAFGSTSIDVKRGSADAEERELAGRLREGERVLFEVGSKRGVAVTILRPTLVYGVGRDRNLHRIAQVARRFGRVVLPRDANGLRQPVHVHDLADAAFRCIDAEASFGRSYALPGGETLTYREMVARVLAALSPPPRLHEVTSPVFNVVLAAAHAAGFALDFNEAAVARMRSDLVFDPADAQRDFGYSPRGFRPNAAMFPV
ncbi:MAG: NAD-dependent epimerase/dehydratase family protein [Lysobacter sp.]|nr:NAD-dependent epimerase/dehydratase family protein [Lysobacter sp.]